MNDEELETAYQTLIKNKPELQKVRPEILKKRLSDISAKRGIGSTESDSDNLERVKAKEKARAGQAELDRDYNLDEDGYSKKTELAPSLVGGLQGLMGGTVGTLTALKNASPIGMLEGALARKLGIENEFTPMETPGPQPTNSKRTASGATEDSRGMLDILRDRYIAERDKFSEYDAKMQESPEYHAANTAGAILPSIIPVGAAASTAAKVAPAQAAVRAGLAGGAVGGAQAGLSDSTAVKGEILPFEELAKDVGVGAGLGYGLGSTLGYAGSKLGQQRLPKEPKPKKESGIDRFIVDMDESYKEGKGPIGAVLNYAAKKVKGKNAPEPIQGPDKQDIAYQALAKDMSDRNPSGRKSFSEVPPDDILAYNSGQKLDFSESADDAAKLLDEPSMTQELPSNTPPSREELMKQVNDEVARIMKGIEENPGGKTQSLEPDKFKDARAKANDLVETKTFGRPKAKSWRDEEPTNNGRGYRELKPDDMTETISQDNVMPNRQNFRINFDEDTGTPIPQETTGSVLSKPIIEEPTKAPPSRKTTKSEEVPVKDADVIPEGTDTIKENANKKEVLNLNQFRNEFRKQTKGMNEDDMKDAFTPEELQRNADYGKEIGMTGDKLVNEFGGDRNEAAKFLLTEGHAESIDDLVKLLGMKGKGATEEAEKLAKELGFDNLPKYADGSSKARRRKSVADRATVEKKKSKKELLDEIDDIFKAKPSKAEEVNNNSIPDRYGPIDPDEQVTGNPNKPNPNNPNDRFSYDDWVKLEERFRRSGLRRNK